MRMLAIAAVLIFSSQGLSDAPPNILFIAIDDMNDWTGFLGGHPQAKTPNLDALAARSVNFTNAHCVSPACSPSRNALLYGVEPFHSGLYPFYDHDKIPSRILNQYVSLPALFKNSGYQTFGAGKIHHGSRGLPNEWTDYHQHAGPPLQYDAAAGYQQGTSKKMAFCPTTNPDDQHPDHQVASYGIDVLSQEHDQPFFLAVGIVKPHLPFVCPQRFFDMFPEQVEPPPIRLDDLQDVPWAARANAKRNDDDRYRRDKAWTRVRRAYLACIAWADFNIGRVLAALQSSQYADNTIIIVWSDHGYHLGEKRSFRKFSLWEEATRVPFLIHDPRPQTAMKPGECSEAVSLINVYRTLTELAGIQAPEYVDGVSLAAQIKDPSTALHQPAITTWGRGNYSARGDFFRYTRYFDGSEELYRHRSDPNEWENLAADKKHAAKKESLSAGLPTKEAPLVQEGISLWNSTDADKPSMTALKKKWKN